MITVRFPPHLRRFIELPPECHSEGATLVELFEDLERQFPGVRSYLVHENGELRQHVNLFFDGSLHTRREGLQQSLENVSEVVIMQALSGG